MGLESLAIPQNVTSVGWGAFLNCTGLRSISVPNANTQVNGTAFAGCSNIDSIYWNSKVSQISTENFKNNLKYVELGDSVAEIGDDVFASCTNLSSIVLSSNLKSIGNKAFKDCDKLSLVNFPEGLLTIGNESFAGCANLQSISIPSSVTSIGDHAFAGCSHLKSITIPSGVSTIEECTFEDCVGLEAITIPKNITEIGWRAFKGCTGLKSITVSSGVSYIDWDAFEECTNVDTIYWNSQVTPRVVTQYCYATLRTIFFGDSVKSISDSVFADCTNLQSIIISASAIQIDQSVFDKSVYSKAFVYVPMGCRDNYKNADGWKYFKYIFERGASMCHLSYYIDYEFYEEIYYQYGDSVVPVTVPVTEGFVFSGWDYEPLIADDNYSIMGYFTPSTVVAGVTKGEDDIVYDLMGRRISVEGLETLPPGIYIVNGRKMVVQ